jgi:hypothetical protein
MYLYARALAVAHDRDKGNTKVINIYFGLALLQAGEHT